MDAWNHIDSIVTSQYEPPSKDFLVGLDETGKGELVGHTVLTGVIFPKELFGKIDRLLGPADTKKRHEFQYWDDIFRNLDRLKDEGFDFVIEKLPPWYVDKYNINKILDVKYQRVLSIFFRKADISNCRIVLDDYGVGPTLHRFFKFLEKQGAEVVISSKSDTKYLEAKAASLVSKREREAVIKSINEKADFKVEGLSVGSGNAGNPQTLAWVKAWRASKREWPWFIKRSYSTIRELEGRTGPVGKVVPPIRYEILSDEFKEEFNKGHLSIEALSLVCPYCGNVLKLVGFANFERNGRRISELKCSNVECGKLIENAGLTLRFYCGYAIPDSSAIRRNLISNDLAASRFFEDFNIILHPVVRKECDPTPKGREEFDNLRHFNTRGRIKLEALGKIEDVPDDLSNVERDERIIDGCSEYNALLVTADNNMSTFAVGKNIFTILV